MRVRARVGLALLTTALVGTGCAEKRYSELVLEEGYLESPEGERIPLGESRDEGDRVHRPGWRRWTNVKRGDHSMTVRLSLDSQRPRPERTLLVSLHGRAEPNARIVESEAYSQLDRGPRTPLQVLPPEGESYPATEDEPGSSHHRLGFMIPAPLSRYGLYMPGANLVESTWKAMERDEGNTYVLHIPFVVGEERWVHHMRFEIEAKTRLVGGVPATP